VRSTTSKTDHRFDLPALPVSVVSLDGQVVGTDQPSWLLRSSADGGKLLALKWSRLDDSAILTERARYLVKLFLADKISRKKARTIENDFRMFFRFQGWLQSIHRVSFEWSDLTEGIAQQRSHCSYRYHEANAARLGFDPEEMYKPLLKPLRGVSRSGSSRKWCGRM